LVELMGLSPAKIAATNALAFVSEEDRPLITKEIQDALEAGTAKEEVRLITKHGIRHYILTATGVETTSGPNVIAIGVDITERKRTEDALLHAIRAHRTLSEANRALVLAPSEDELLRAVTSVIVDKGGYPMAAVGYPEDDTGKSIKFVAWTGTEERHYMSVERPTWVDTEQGQSPIARAIRSGTLQICRDIASDTGFKPWRDSALARGYASNIVLPLTGGGKTFGGLSIYSSEADAFDEEEVRLLEELANDLAYGITTLRTRVEHEQHATILRQGLEQSIQTIANTVEARDPYTAGHQRRVGELSTAIAREMGLPEDQVYGIHLAAIIHDLGKIHIPAEILAKPGKLSAIEFMLVKTHPQAGYDILKDVTFPWPIADIVLQHHEKLDGSGYPQGLKQGQILLEARIVAVADVVEAMSSHRPYRPGLGIEAALEEIERQRGVQYDAVAVDACIKLFRERGYMLPA
jgi:PAS domain S-box-containing protein